MQVRMYSGTLLQRRTQTLRVYSQAAALFLVKWRHDRHLEIMTSNQKFDTANRW